MLSFGNRNNLFAIKHCVKSACIWSYSGPHFLVFGLNTERYGVSVRIQSQCGKMWTRITLKVTFTDTFYAVKVFFFVDKDDECTTKDRIIEKLKRNAEKIERKLEEVNHEISRSRKDCGKLQTKNELYEKELMNLVEENETLLQDRKNLQNELEVCS